jgi:hypothetical protein
MTVIPHRVTPTKYLGSYKYLNNLIEQDHRSGKLRLGPRLGLKRIRNASMTVAVIELMHRIRKGQFKLGRLRIKDNRAPEIGNAVLVAWPGSCPSRFVLLSRKICTKTLEITIPSRHRGSPNRRPTPSRHRDNPSRSSGAPWRRQYPPP